MADIHKEWTEEDSRRYRELASVAVPAREEQIATILTLLPFQTRDAFRVVELGCGEGALTYAILDCFPHASAVALDGSATMRARTTACLRPFASRTRVEPFDLAATNWFSHLDAADCVVSSLCVHHLSSKEKQHLFFEVAQHLSERGAFILADLVEPQRQEARALFAATWDQATQAQASTQSGSGRLFEKFLEERWNYYRFPDPRDRPSPLLDQLMWLKEAGFAVADCFRLQAGHAIYGGYKAPAVSSTAGISLSAALQSAHTALGAISSLTGDN